MNLEVKRLTKIILVRHVQAEGNEKRFFQGAINTEITPKGALQIERTAELLKDEKIDALYASPLKRAVATAEGINTYHNLPLILHEGLKEIDAGVWDGVYLNEISEKYSEDQKNWDSFPHLFQPEKSEGMQSVYNRVWKAVSEILKDNEGKTICIVSHGCAIRNILCHAHNKPIEQLATIPWGTNGAVSVLEFSDGTVPKIIVENSTNHLEGI